MTQRKHGSGRWHDAFALTLALAASALPLAAQPPWAPGSWEPLFDHSGTDPAAIGQTCYQSAIYKFPPDLTNPDPTKRFPFNAIHMSLIPVGDKRGQVMVWNSIKYPGDGTGQTRQVHYAILDPKQPASATNPENFCVNLPPNEGDLFCAGHAWTAGGELLIVGGTRCQDQYGPAPCYNRFGGSRLVCIWTPPNAAGIPVGGSWRFPPVLDDFRWYPSMTAVGPHPVDGNNRFIVSGGVDLANRYNCPDTPGHDPTKPSDPVGAINSYQVWDEDPTEQFFGGRWEVAVQIPLSHEYPGPSASGLVLENYPRAHLVSWPPANDPQQLARVVFAGFPDLTDLVSHYQAPSGWIHDAAWKQVSYREYNSTVLLPYALGMDSDALLSIGGNARTPLCPFPPHGTVAASVERCVPNATGSGRYWQAYDTLNHPRWVHNTVLLPDGRVVVLGGEGQWGGGEGCVQTPVLEPEIHDSSQGAGSGWTTLDPQGAVRDYHFTALLLPDGRILTGGGESRHHTAPTCVAGGTTNNVWPADYQIYRPDYLTWANAVPPQITSIPNTTWNYGLSYLVMHNHAGLPDGVTIDRVMLVRPGSVTHHSDLNQRVVELPFTPANGGSLTVTVPSKLSGKLPRGHYMLFLISSQNVTTQGVPSEAAWIEIAG